MANNTIRKSHHKAPIRATRESGVELPTLKHVMTVEVALKSKLPKGRFMPPLNPDSSRHQKMQNIAKIRAAWDRIKDGSPAQV